MGRISPDLILLFGLLASVALVVINIAFAVGVFADSTRLHRRGSTPKIVPGPMWAFATLVGGVMVAGVYWFIHHSKFFDRDN